MTEKKTIKILYLHFPSNKFLNTIFFITPLLCIINLTKRGQLSKYVTNYLDRKTTLKKILELTYKYLKKIWILSNSFLINLLNGHFQQNKEVKWHSFTIHTYKIESFIIFIVFQIFTPIRYPIKLKTLSSNSVQQSFLILMYFQRWERKGFLFLKKKKKKSILTIPRKLYVLLICMP